MTSSVNIRGKIKKYSEGDYGKGCNVFLGDGVVGYEGVSPTQILSFNPRT